MAARDAAGTGIGSDCQIPRMSTRGSIGDIGKYPSAPIPHYQHKQGAYPDSFNRDIGSSTARDALPDLEG
jgi:hypothetical protein